MEKHRIIAAKLWIICAIVARLNSEVICKNFRFLTSIGGIPSSLEHNSNEQWDFPNGWAPQQHLFVISLLQCKDNAEANKIAREVANAFLTTAYNGMFSPIKSRASQGL